MKAPIKLIKEGDTIKGIFKFPLDFAEGSNSEGYPTALLNTTFYQFAPKGLDKVTYIGGRLVIISYNSLEDRVCKNFMKSGNFEGII